MIAGRPRVLVVDDDPVSLRFLCLALAQGGCEPVAAADGATAHAHAQARRFDLLLIDRNLDGTSGPALLRGLRELGVRVPAIATSADLTARDREALLASGFVDTLPKPSTVADVGALVARHVGGSRDAAAAQGAAEPPVPALLDDTAALAALGGDTIALVALRRLFRAELDALLKDSDGLPLAALGARVHRLRASCGFCGAQALAAAAAALQHAIASGAEARSERQAFLAACAVLSEALAQRDPSSVAAS